MEFNELVEILHKKYPDLDVYSIKTNNFIFEERVKQKCFHCANYNIKWTCPPRTPAVDYPKMFSEYEHAVVVVCKCEIKEENFEDVRSLSTNTIHKALLYLEGELYKLNNSLALSFIGGSCKLCKNGCNKDHCANPYKSRMPWEATGCNIVRTLQTIGINIDFPPTKYLYRYGLFLW